MLIIYNYGDCEKLMHLFNRITKLIHIIQFPVMYSYKLWEPTTNVLVINILFSDMIVPSSWSRGIEIFDYSIHDIFKFNAGRLVGDKHSL